MKNKSNKTRVKALRLGEVQGTLTLSWSDNETEILAKSLSCSSQPQGTRRFIREFMSKNGTILLIGQETLKIDQNEKLH